MDDLAKPAIDTKMTTDNEFVKADPVARDADGITEGELYATYELDHAHPYLADYFDLGELWNNRDLTYNDEIGTIDAYLQAEIKDKTLANSTKAVSDRVKQLEKLAGIDKNASSALRVQQLAAFTKYLSELNDIKLKVKFT